MTVPRHESEKLKKAATRIATATTYDACMQWFCAFLEIHAGWKTLTDQKKVLGGGELYQHGRPKAQKKKNVNTIAIIQIIVKIISAQ